MGTWIGMTRVRGVSRLAATALCALLVTGLTVVVQAGTAGAAIPAGATVVGADSAACGGATPNFASISAAVSAASAGDTIYVCPGVYDESVVITKSLTLLGSQNGVAADDPTVRTDPSQESIIDAPVITDPNNASQTTATSPIEYSAAVGGTVDGFTLEGGSGTNGSAFGGIMALNGSGTGSFDFVNNIITDNGEGMQFFTGGTSTPTSTVSGNRFLKNNNDSADGRSGSGIFLSNGVPNNLTITDNYFDDNGGGNGDVNTTGAGAGCASGVSSGDEAQNVVISHNVSVHDDGFENNFAVIFCTVGAEVSDNTVTYTDPDDANAETAIYLGGGDTSVTVTGNTLTGGTSATGISFNADFYPEGPGDTISDNTISDHSDGIVVRGSNSAVAGNDYPGASDFTISGNTITGSATDGIWVQDGSDGTISSNSATGSGSNDCQDSTSGSGTLGTADTWTDDMGSTSSPTGLCAVPGTNLPEAPSVMALPASAAAVGVGAFLIVRRRNRRAKVA
jgi:parallel beta-helix repeat protein